METAKKYNQNEYNKKFMDKIKDKKYKCDVCGKDYSYYAKSKHCKTQYHKLAENIKSQFIQANVS
jgi:transposase-like protein